MATVDQTMMKVQRLLTGPMGLRIQLQGDTISITFNDMSTAVNVRIIDWGQTKEGEPRTLVRVSAPIVRGVKPTPVLYEYLAREAPRMWFGSIAVWDDEETPGCVSLSLGHTLLGDYLDEEELSAVVFGVLNSADELDDVMQQKFGGKRWVDN